MTSKKIIDCFTFFNELDLLEIRLEYLYETIDYFVIIESNKSFSGNEKEYILKNNLSRFKKYQDKIVYIPLNMILFKESKNTAWQREAFQRNAIKNGLTSLDLTSKDLILIGDLDEIPNTTILKELKNQNYIFDNKLSIFKYFKSLFDAFFNNDWSKIKLLKRIIFNNINSPVSLGMENFLYFVNNKEIKSSWKGTMALEMATLKNSSPNEIRNLRNYCNSINQGGWHFSYLGGVEKIKHKLKSYSHQEYNKPEIVNNEFIEKCINNGYSLSQYYKGNETVYFTKYDIDLFPKNLKDILKGYPLFISK